VKRTFTMLSVMFCVVLVVVGCKAEPTVTPVPTPTPIPTPSPTPVSLLNIVLDDGDQETIAGTIIAERAKIAQFAQSPGQQLRIATLGEEAFLLSMQDKTSLRVTHEETGESRLVSLGVGRKGLLTPELQVSVEGGGEKHENSVANIFDLNPEDLVKFGAGAVAVGLGLWLVGIAGGVILSAVSLVVFLSLALGISTLFVGGVLGLFEQTDISFDVQSILDFLERGVGNILDAIQGFAKE
jgi:hypothetical protein